MVITDERKRILNSVCMNFAGGIIIGIILFYSQLKEEISFTEHFELEKSITFEDLLRIAWMNMLWLVCVFLARCVAPMRYMHPIIMIRGLINGFFGIVYHLSVRSS